MDHLQITNDDFEGSFVKLSAHVQNVLRFLEARIDEAAPAGESSGYPAGAVSRPIGIEAGKDSRGPDATPTACTHALLLPPEESETLSAWALSPRETEEKASTSPCPQVDADRWEEKSAPGKIICCPP